MYYLKKGDHNMAKAGMRRPDPSEPHGTESNKRQNFSRNEQAPVPELQGHGKTGNAKAENKRSQRSQP
jgi:hypothetical protein